ncbi:hypothetical protein G9A89_022380 [Geosiphon pyriformis]|nr:hypothetical protein G9A89_022380 [Geosiphon pyriformis]
MFCKFWVCFVFICLPCTITCLTINVKRDLNPKTKYNKLIVFGDIYSDNGNTFKLSGGKYPNPPSRYYKGRYTNGLLWPDYIQKILDIELLNFSYGGATADNDYFQGKAGHYLIPDFPVPGFIQQVKTFNETYSEITDFSKSLAVTFLTGADYAYNFNNPDPKSIISVFPEAWKILYNRGITSFLVPLLPRIWEAPFFGSLDPIARGNLIEKANTHNQLLQDAIENFKKSNQDVDMKLFDTPNFLDKNNFPAILNFTNPCINYEIVPPVVCQEPTDYFYYDLYCLSNKVHSDLGWEIAGRIGEL